MDSSLADFTGEALIIPALQSRDMVGVIAELSAAFGNCAGNWNVSELNRLAHERESQMSTAMDFGAAFPHVRSFVCPRLQFALGRAPEPIEWGRPGSLRIEFVFLNAIPADDTGGYLKLVSAMARLGRHPALREQLRWAAGTTEILKVLARIPIRK